ncbi:enoyl CoA hydratase-like protein [Xylariaceae sp. FL1272]|nr:enoyl CoA hydratase-like protein [Xylariaceae sp. FL1272]
MAATLEGYTGYKHFLISSPAENVVLVQTNRPEKLNAFFEAMWLELGAIFNQISHDPNVRAVVFSAVGEKAFTAGLDVQAASSGGTLSTQGGKEDVGRLMTKLRRHIYEFQDSVSAIEKCEKPVIVALHGISIGLAIDLACCADVRIASKDTKFSVKEVDIGIAADIGTLSRLPKIVGSHSWVKEVTLSARFFGADEALAVGFVSQVHETKAKAVEAAIKIASLISTKSPIAVQGTKHILNHARDNTVAESLRYTAVWNAGMVQSEDMGKAMLSGLKKTKPTFEKL